MSSRCSICKKPGKKGDKLFKCSGDCGERFHSDCAVSNFDLGVLTLQDDAVFLCNSCTSHSCQICKCALKQGDSQMVCTGECSGYFHLTCAAQKFGFSLGDSDMASDFRCDLCLMQRSTVTPRTPHSSPRNRSNRNNTDSNTNNNDAKFDELMAQMKVMCEFMSTQFAAINASLVESKTSNELMSAKFTAELTAVNSSLGDMGRNIDDFGRRIDGVEANFDKRMDGLETNLHNEITAVSTTVEEVVSRVTQLESKNNLNNPALVALIENSDTSDKLSISGLPLDTGDSPKSIVKKVLTALEIPDLASDVLSIHNLPHKAKRPDAIGNPGDASSSVVVRSNTILVKMKSQTLRDHVVNTKREKKQLYVKNIWSQSHRTHPGQIFINEELPQSTYKLYLNAKVKAKSTHSQVWIRGGRIYVRKSHGAPALLISSDTDLAQLD